MPDNNRPDGHWKSGAEGPRDPKFVKQEERIADDIAHAADYQIQPDGVRPDEAYRTETGTAHRADRAAGLHDDPETLSDAETAFRRSNGE